MSDSLAAKDKSNFARRIKDARIGDPIAQYDIALMYANGVGVGRNVAQAFSWTQKAAEKGHVAAQYLLAVAFQTGLGTKKSEQSALLWLVRAAERGHERAQLRLSKLFTDAQPGLAFQMARLGAERGLAEAQHTVAACLDAGTGVDQSHTDAFEWHRKAAEGGFVAAQYAIAQHLEGEYGGPIDVELAQLWYLKASGQGHPGARLALDRLDSADRSRVESPRTKREMKGLSDLKIVDRPWVAFAEKGSGDDQYHLALMFQRGVGVEQSQDQARFWFDRAATQAHAAAQYCLGQMLVESKSIQAASWLERAAQQGHIDAQVALGCLLMPPNSDPNAGLCGALTKAFGWLALAANQGNGKALFLVGNMVAGALSLEYLALSAHGGYPDAQYALGKRYEAGGDLPVDYYEACRWYQLAADQEHAEAQCALAGCFASGLGVVKDAAQAFYWYERSALQGLPKAQWNLGEMVARGLHGVKQDPKRAAVLCKSAARAGFAPAQATMGLLFAKAKKYAEAVHWWQLAADQGDMESAYNLCNAHRLGLGIPKNTGMALELLIQAAQGGLAAAQGRLGLAYATGDLTVLDVIEATKWFVLAAQQDDPSSLENLKKAKQSLSLAQWAEATFRAQRFLKG